MSSAYTLDHIIRECSEERSRMEVTRGRNPRGRPFYEEAWQALNAWIESRLKRRQGATISPLGDFTWEIKTSADGENQCRPIFMVGDSFVKDHHIRLSKFHKPTNLAKCEDVNYSKLAIKFSKTLTKDMIFAGVRDLLKKIGDYIDRIYEIEIQFSFGVLRSKERRIKFEFDNSRLMQILPSSMAEQLAEQTLGYSQSTNSFSGAGTSRSEDLALGNSMSSSRNGFDMSSTLPSIKTNQVPDSSRSTGFSRPNSEGDQCMSFSPAPATAESKNPDSNRSAVPNLNLTYKDVDRSGPAPPMSPALKELLDSMDEKNLSRAARIERRMQACDSVAKQAFKRCLHRVESSAVDDDYLEFQSRKLFREYQEREKSKKERFKKELSELQDTLRSQIKEVRDRKEREVYEHKHGKVHVGLPGQVMRVEPSRDEIKQKKKEMLKALEQQIRTNEEELRLKRQQTLAEEGVRLNNIKNDLELDRLMARADQLQKQRDLLEAWEREAHLRNLQKVQAKGANAVKDYMQSTGLISEEEFSSRSPATGTYRLSAMTGIGFDTRRGK
mmetsp:Transcript_1794/g.2818  ORF Transcript_1794/g.2818 Transcript_1794/m.2818 type:complete len:555 (-) Transcript_1794:165-1829(-)|eukprot:CAMPEP_0185019460 /NCGR_PEP_ID=MMETSP1103-20130426/2070_1 /TAXON_ID=36769 /ORGANISM="Paraphysomonas bandaiensis, Strain Caron Lab Isolate" /LENGTH=554 /DNA_ID=CAMNT_0027549787 /DNA_START=53 /DNA_END=1717 /DNA_ORIENTATION=+